MARNVEVTVTQEDVALAALVREAQVAAVVAEPVTRGRDKSMSYSLLIALGLLFLAASSLVMHSTGRIALVVLACVAFLIAVILTLVGPAGVPGG